MTDISKHPLLKQAYDVCQAIEACGASVELTNAVTKASQLLMDLDKFIDAKLPVQAGPKVISEGEIVSAVRLGHAVAQLSVGIGALSCSAKARMAVEALIVRLSAGATELLTTSVNVAEIEPLAPARGGVMRCMAMDAIRDSSTLEAYFDRTLAASGAIDFAVRCTPRVSGGADFYIHPANVDGETLQFTVQGNTLISV